MSTKKVILEKGDKSMSVLFDVRGRKPPEVEIVLVNWNRWKDTIECMESLRQIDYSSYRLVIIDNGSSDNSLEKIREYAEGTTMALGLPTSLKGHSKAMKECTRKEIEDDLKSGIRSEQLLPMKFVLIRNEKNFGTVEGYNIAIRYALKEHSDYILLLNNDVTVDKNFLKELVRVAESSPEIGIVGSTIYYYDKPDVINFAGEDMILWKAEGVRYTDHFSAPREVDKIDGACMLIKRDVFEKVGLIDTDYYMYWEDADFCQRAKRKGFKVVYVPAAKIWHKIAASGGGLYSYNRMYYLTRNRFLFVRKNVRRLHRMLFLIHYFGWEIWFSMAVFLKFRTQNMIRPMVNGSLDGFYLLVCPSATPVLAKPGLPRK